VSIAEVAGSVYMRPLAKYLLAQFTLSSEDRPQARKLLREAVLEALVAESEADDDWALLPRHQQVQ
jgi:hypothetical protein